MGGIIYMRNFLNWLDKHRTASNLFVAIVGVAVYMLLSNIGTVATALGTVYSFVATLVAGIIIAYVLLPLCRLFEYYVFKKMKNRKAARSLGVLCGFIAALAAIALLMWAIIPEIIASGELLVTNMDGYIASLKTTLLELQAKIPYFDLKIEETLGSWTMILDSITAWVMDNVTQILNYTLNIGSGIFDGIVAFFLSIYILLDRRNLLLATKRFFHAMLRADRFERFCKFSSDCDNILKSYLGGNIIDTVIIGVFNYIYLICVGSPNAGLLAVVNGVTNFIPTFGPFIGAIPSAFIILLTEENGLSKALWFAVFTVIIQQIDGNVIKPVLFGGAAGIAPVYVLISITVFGKIFGLVGMLLGVPIFAMLALVYNNFIASRLNFRKLNDIYKTERSEEKKTSWSKRLLNSLKGRGKSIIEQTASGKKDNK